MESVDYGQATESVGIAVQESDRSVFTTGGLAHLEKLASDPILAAAYALVEQMANRTDKPGPDYQDGRCPMWYGWALREAFLSGVAWQKEQSAKP